MPKIFVLCRGKYSKRIRKKPLSRINGKTLVEYTLDVCKQLPYETFLFTDLQEVKNIASIYDVNIREKVYESPIGTHRTKEEIIFYNEKIGADIIILLQVTSPFRDIEKVKEWIHDFMNSDYDCGIAAYRQDGFFYQKEALYNLKSRDYNSNGMRPVFKETGSFYIFRFGNIKKNHFINGKIKIYEDPYDIDINTIEDLEKARKYDKIICK